MTKQLLTHTLPKDIQNHEASQKGDLRTNEHSISKANAVPEKKGMRIEAESLDSPSPGAISAGFIKQTSRFFDADNALTGFDEETYDYYWALKKEPELYSKLNSLQNLNLLEINTLECKSSSCKISGSAYLSTLAGISTLSESLNKALLNTEFDRLSIKTTMEYPGRLGLEMVLAKKIKNNLESKNGER